MSNPSTQNAALHPTQVRLRKLPQEVVAHLQKLIKSDPPGILTIDEPSIWMTLAVGIIGFACAGGYASYKGLEFFQGVGWIVLAIIAVPSLYALIMGIRSATDYVLSPMRPGLFLAPSHLLIVRNGELTCIPRSRILNLRLIVDSHRVEIVLDDGTKFWYSILATQARPIEHWLQQSQGSDEDWPMELFLDWKPDPVSTPLATGGTLPGGAPMPQTPNDHGKGLPPVRHRISMLSKHRRQYLRGLVKGSVPGLRLPWSIPHNSSKFVLLGLVFPFFPFVMAFRGELPGIWLVGFSFAFSIVPLLFGLKDIDYRFLSPMRPGVYVDAHHLFAIFQREVLVFGLQGLRVVREVQFVSGSSPGTEVTLEVAGAEWTIWVPDPNFVALFGQHLKIMSERAGANEPGLDVGSGPWADLATADERSVDRQPAKEMTSFQRRIAFLGVFLMAAAMVDLTAGRAFGYWMQLFRIQTTKGYVQCLESVEEGAPDWFRSRVESQVWNDLQRNPTIPELIRFLGWRGAYDHRADAQAQLRNAAQAALNQMRGSVDPRAQFQHAWLSQMARTGEWRIGVSVRDSVASWPATLLEGMDRSTLVRDYDSAVLSVMGKVLCEEGCFTTSLPLSVMDPTDRRPPLLFLESVLVDQKTPAVESLRHWKLWLPDGAILMDISLPVDAWQMSQLRLPAKESALGEYLRSEMRQKLDSAGRAWKASMQ